MERLKQVYFLIDFLKLERVAEHMHDYLFSGCHGTSTPVAGDTFFRNVLEEWVGFTTSGIHEQQRQMYRTTLSISS
eukprot:457878-Pyramimonas_sp.AAC.1